MKNLRSIWLLLLIIPFALSDCSKQKEISCSGTTSFKRDIIPIFNANCALSGCHTGSSSQAGLRLDSAYAYYELNHDGYALAGKPNYSIIYNQVLGTGGVPIMPPTPAAHLDHTLTDEIYCWIQEGALDN